MADDVRVIVFAQAPVPGSAKTQLIPALGALGAALLARRLLENTLAAVIGARLGPVELCMSPDPGADEWRSVTLPARVERTAQGDGGPGARLARAAERGIADSGRAMIVGTDCPGMSAILLRAAAAALADTGSVIVRSADGGYALLGLSRYDDLLFRGIPWGTGGVATAFVRRFEHLGWPLHVGRTLHEVDEPRHLLHLPSSWLQAVRKGLVSREWHTP